MTSYILTGQLMHTRRAPARNAFTYPVFSLLLDLDDLPALNRLPIFGYNRFKVVSVHSQDHWGDAQRDIKANILAFLAERGVQLSQGKIWLLTNPRIFGYVFNPISFYYCYAASGEWICTVAEVNNTFGETYVYWLDEQCALPSHDTAKRYGADKVFYVSPFIAMDARYEFAFTPCGDSLRVHIDEFRQGEKFFQVRLWGDLQPLTTCALWSVLWRYPLLTVKIIALIHWQALKLWRLKVPWLDKRKFTYKHMAKTGSADFDVEIT
jgi:hypothetical protein